MPLSKLTKLIEIVRVNGGIGRSLLKLYLHDDLKEGRLVGKDEFGNKYYENNRYFIGRNRWVEYNPNVWLDYDATMITPDWYGWMHYKTDLLPCEDPSRKYYDWMQPYSENLTGTPRAYYPYSTVKPKIIPWKPKKTR